MVTRIKVIRSGAVMIAATNIMTINECLRYLASISDEITPNLPRKKAITGNWNTTPKTSVNETKVFFLNFIHNINHLVCKLNDLSEPYFSEKLLLELLFILFFNSALRHQPLEVNTHSHLYHVEQAHYYRSILYSSKFYFFAFRKMMQSEYLSHKMIIIR